MAILDRSQLSDAERNLAGRVFQRLAEAEAHVHGTAVQQVHFHEVGAVDSIVDIVGGCVGWVWLQLDRVIASPVPVGGGVVEIAPRTLPRAMPRLRRSCYAVFRWQMLPRNPN